MTIPGVSDVVAQVIVSEIGVDMSRFPTAGHLISWAGLCPRNDRERRQAPLDSVAAGSAMAEDHIGAGGLAAARCKQGYLPAQFLRIKSRRGPKKAIMAVAASMLTAAYHILRDDVDYKDLGGDYFHRTDRKKTADRLVKRLGDLGFTVEIKEAA